METVVLLEWFRRDFPEIVGHLQAFPIGDDLSRDAWTHLCLTLQNLPPNQPLPLLLAAIGAKISSLGLGMGKIFELLESFETYFQTALLDPAATHGWATPPPTAFSAGSFRHVVVPSEAPTVHASLDWVLVLNLIWAANQFDWHLVVSPPTDTVLVRYATGSPRPLPTCVPLTRLVSAHPGNYPLLVTLAKASHHATLNASTFHPAIRPIWDKVWRWLESQAHPSSTPGGEGPERDFIVLVGVPACGKSTFLRQLVATLEGRTPCASPPPTPARCPSSPGKHPQGDAGAPGGEAEGEADGTKRERTEDMEPVGGVSASPAYPAGTPVPESGASPSPSPAAPTATTPSEEPQPASPPAPAGPAQHEQQQQQQQQQQEQQRVHIASTDDLLAEMYPGLTYAQQFERLKGDSSINRIFQDRLLGAIRAGQHIIIDQTNLTENSRLRKLRQLQQENRGRVPYRRVAVVFLVTPRRLEMHARARAETTGKMVPRGIVAEMLTTYTLPTHDDFDEIRYIHLPADPAQGYARVWVTRTVDPTPVLTALPRWDIPAPFPIELMDSKYNVQSPQRPDYHSDFGGRGGRGGGRGGCDRGGYRGVLFSVIKCKRLLATVRTPRQSVLVPLTIVRVDMIFFLVSLASSDPGPQGQTAAFQAVVERSYAAFHDRWRRHTRSTEGPNEKFAKPVTSAMEIGWQIEQAPPRSPEMSQGIRNSTVTKYADEMALLRKRGGEVSFLRLGM
ncbi:hypothetical protein PAPYR_6325 [Paratrimastix pyriformis]|uniref:Uncharacterized protein n=1 Tax=Paratrimastix pyriformis TaxID=342808 RepID=A0ABQ8UJE4_9EUKA|nr:hypothetical protein PAPYR_6325 [Paratrimastix pyriformis]